MITILIDENAPSDYDDYSNLPFVSKSQLLYDIVCKQTDSNGLQPITFDDIDFYEKNGKYYYYYQNTA